MLRVAKLSALYILRKKTPTAELGDSKRTVAATLEDGRILSMVSKWISIYVWLPRREDFRRERAQGVHTRWESYISLENRKANSDLVKRLWRRQPSSGRAVSGKVRSSWSRMETNWSSWGSKAHHIFCKIRWRLCDGMGSPLFTDGATEDGGDRMSSEVYFLLRFSQMEQRLIGRCFTVQREKEPTHTTKATQEFLRQGGGQFCSQSSDLIATKHAFHWPKTKLILVSTADVLIRGMIFLKKIFFHFVAVQFVPQGKRLILWSLLNYFSFHQKKYRKAQLDNYLVRPCDTDKVIQEQSVRDSLCSYNS